VKGKLAYLAPERIDKRRTCTVQSDVFSLAVVLWECFAGRRLFRGDEAVDILQEVLTAPIPTLLQIGAQIPPALDDVIARALSRDLDTRYASALLLAEALERAAGPENVGTHSDVARLMEAVFGQRMAMRQEQVRATIGRSNLADLLRASGLPARERPPASDMPAAPLPAELAPPAPTGPYPSGTERRAAFAGLRPRRVPWRLIAAAAGGVAIGAVATPWALANHAKGPTATGYAAASAGSAPGAPLAPTTRKVVLPLPFVSVRVNVDDDAVRALDPATDVIALDLPVASSARHRVIAVATDGTRADGYVSEVDGIARPVGDGYTFTLPSEGNDDARRGGGPIRTRPVGTVRNGFTKLR
jgi:serine/threonine-protein kinase